MTDNRTEELTIAQHWLGMRPYTLIELRPASDGSGDPALFVEAGGGAEDEPLYMPLLALSESAPAGNPVAEILRTAWSADPGARVGVEAVTREFNAEWLPFVTGSA